MLTIFGTLGFMLAINLQITLVVLLVTPLSLFVASFVAKRTYALFFRQSETRAEQTALIDEMVGNQKAVSYTHLAATPLRSPHIKFVLFLYFINIFHILNFMIR